MNKFNSTPNLIEKGKLKFQRDAIFMEQIDENQKLITHSGKSYFHKLLVEV